MKIKKEINKISYGLINSYWPFRFETQDSYNEICNNIKCSSIVYSKDYYEKKIQSFDSETCELKELIEDKLHDIYINNIEIESSMIELVNFMNQYLETKEMDETDFYIVIQEKELKVQIKSSELEVLKKREEQYCSQQELFEKFYGNNFVESYTSYILLPLKIKLCNGNIVYINCILYVFANKMGIIKLEIPISDIELYQVNYILSDCIDEIIGRKDFNYEWPANDLYDIAGFYIYQLLEQTKHDMVRYKHGMDHIMLIDYENAPKYLNKMPDGIQEGLFKIVASPVETGVIKDLRKQAKEYLNNNCWEKNHVNYYIKTTGGCLTVIDRHLLDESRKMFCLDNNKEHLTLEDKEFLNEKIAFDIFVNTEFALLILILKKTNNCSNYNQKMFMNKDFDVIQNEYWQNKLFISELQDNCYGTVYEQMQLFEEKMTHYFHLKLRAEKDDSINKIIEQKQYRKNEKLQKLLSAFSTIIVVILGLPAIVDTVKIFKGENYIYSTQLSIILYIIMMIFILGAYIKYGDFFRKIKGFLSKIKSISKMIIIGALAIFMIIASSLYSNMCDLQKIKGDTVIKISESPQSTYTLLAYSNKNGIIKDKAILCTLIDNEDKENKNIYWKGNCNKVEIKWISESDVIINGEKLNVTKDAYDSRRE